MNISPHLQSLADRFSKLGRPLRILIGLIIAAVIVILAFFLFGYLAVYLLARSYVDQLAQVFDLNNYLARAIVWATFAAAVIFVGYAVSFSRPKRLAGLGAFEQPWRDHNAHFSHAVEANPTRVSRDAHLLATRAERANDRSKLGKLSRASACAP
jgi:hypothetical protein